LLHDAVAADLEDIVKVLLEKCPKLATRLRSEKATWPNGRPDGRHDFESSVLALVQKTPSGQTIKSYILPVLISSLQISDVRFHLQGGSCMRSDTHDKNLKPS
jgi:hypothetical protein